MERIVVGVDGSPGSQQALTWALEEAALRDAGVRLLCALTSQPAEFPDDAAGMLARVLQEAGGAPAGVSAERVARYGSPARLLVEESEEADLIVVGSRGRGGFTGLLLGSVSQQTVQHAQCPVVVIPAGA